MVIVLFPAAAGCQLCQRRLMPSIVSPSVAGGRLITSPFCRRPTRGKTIIMDEMG